MITKNIKMLKNHE